MKIGLELHTMLPLASISDRLKILNQWWIFKENYEMLLLVLARVSPKDSTTAKLIYSLPTQARP